MGARCIFLVVFALCATSYSVEARPSKSPSSASYDHETQRQNAVENNARLNQTIHYRHRNNGHADEINGNDIMHGYEKSKDMEKAIKYMHKYGYMPVPNHPASKMPDMTAKYLKENIKKMQTMMGVHVTGELDDVTMAMIDTPRCGVHDPVNFISIPDGREDERQLRIEKLPHNFLHFGQKWPRNNITYRILSFPHSLNHDYAYTSIQQAFQLWRDVTPLTFTEVDGYADIYLKFRRYEHGDFYPFDGRGGTLAHAFLPQSYQGDLEGDVHFDDDEEFTYRSNRGTNLFHVAAHEIGHALGLHHSVNSGALLTPFNKPYNPQFTLHPEDIAGIQDLYGKPVTAAIPDDLIVTQGHTAMSQSTSAEHVTPSLPPTETPTFIKEQITITSTKTSAVASDVNGSLTERDTVSSPSVAVTVSSADKVDTLSSSFTTVNVSASNDETLSPTPFTGVIVSSSHVADTPSSTSARVSVSTPDETDTSSSLVLSNTLGFESSFSSASSPDHYESDPNERCPPYHALFTGNDDDIDSNDVLDRNKTICNFTFDAVTSYRGEIFAFKGNRYWRVTKDFGLISPLNGAHAGYFFESFPEDIDAAYEQYLTSKLFLFKGVNYYVYNGLTLESGPQPITDLDTSLPSGVDAVLSWGEWHKTYFFKDDLVWRYDEKHGRVDDGWPWLIGEIWTGVPNNLTAAFRWGGYSHFIQDNHLYAYNDDCYYVNPRENPKSFSQEILGHQCPYV